MTEVAPFVFVTPSARGDDEPSSHGIADGAVVAQALEGDPHEHLTAGLEAREILAGSEVGRVQRVRSHDPVSVPELLVVRPFDEHASRAVAPAPDYDRPVGGVAKLQALERQGTLGLGDHDRRCPSKRPVR
jgi:hypothetical protein